MYNNAINEDHPSIIKQKGLESLILLIIGDSTRSISLLHLQKETFLLWNFHPYMKEFIHFIKHYRGPFSSEVEKVILYPYYLDDCWSYEPPSKKDSLSGGYIKLTPKGIEKYQVTIQPCINVIVRLNSPQIDNCTQLLNTFEIDGRRLSIKN